MLEGFLRFFQRKERPEPTPADVARELAALKAKKAAKAGELAAIRAEAEPLRVARVLGREEDPAALNKLNGKLRELEQEVEDLTKAEEYACRALKEASTATLERRREALAKREVELKAEREKLERLATEHLAGLVVILAKLGCQDLVKYAAVGDGTGILKHATKALQDSYQMNFAGPTWTLNVNTVGAAVRDAMWKEKEKLHAFTNAVHSLSNDRTALNQKGTQAIEREALEAAGAPPVSSLPTARLQSDGSLRCANKACNSRRFETRLADDSVLHCRLCGLRQEAPTGASRANVTPSLHDFKPVTLPPSAPEADQTRVVLDAEGRECCSKVGCGSLNLARNMHKPQERVCLDCGHVMEEAPPEPASAAK